MFSVVIPLYNKEQSIKNTIQSVLNQSLQDFEIVLVNDGSTDNSVAVVEQFSDSRIRLIHQENQGVSAARNKGITEAKYDWIAFLDADDEWYENKLNAFKLKIEAYPDINWGFAGFELIRDGILVKNYQYGSEDLVLENIFDDLLKGIKIQTSSVVVRKAFLIKKGIAFTVGINNSEDREVWYKISCYDKNPIYINIPLSKYLIKTGEDSLTKNNLIASSFHFLSMVNRLDPIMEVLNENDKQMFFEFISDYNRRIIYNFWCKSKYLPVEFKDNLNSFTFFSLSRTIFFPTIFKKVILRLIIKGL